MKALPEHIEIVLAALGLLNLVWSIALTLFATHRTDANFRRAATELATAFGSMATEAALANLPRSRKPRSSR